MSVVVKLTQLFEKKQAESEFAPSMGISEAPDSPLSARAALDSVQGGGSLQGPLSLSAEPGGKGQDFGESRFVDAGGLDHVDAPVTLPVLGRREPGQHQRILGAVLALALLALIGLTVFALNQADKTAQQLAATGQALMQSQRLAKSVSQALVGTPAAFPDVADSVGVLNQAVEGLANGDDKLSAVQGSARTELEAIQPLTARAAKNAATVMAQQKVLTQVGAALQGINRQSFEMLELAESVSATKLQQNAPAIEISAAGQLVMMTQRIAKSANEFQTVDGGSPEAVFLLGKDLSAFREITRGLLDGSADLRLGAAKDPGMREQLTTLLKAYDQMRADAGAILGNLQGLVAAREAQSSIIAESEPLRRQLEGLQGLLSSQSGVGLGLILGMVASALLVLASGAGLALVQLRSSQQRQLMAEGQRQQAEHAQLEAKRVNDANQAAILRLMNELQQVAEGDLTQEATVTEDITGAIADSVNYTVEELRALVGSVQNTASRVAQTTAQVDNTSTELLAASTEQLREIRETGRSVLDMASRINEVSTQAQESAAVARQSLQAADSGLQAVQNAIGGMNAIRDQIQDTSKRIKRLGESSQEIGEITELISDITEQTNVLALNAAIQAASAGEAGRGFSVVAEEVQRLAERSGDATRQIAALVKGIQTDTQDAVAAMDRSTQGVVAGAQLSDTAGTALTEIDHVSRRLAELIEQISAITSREAEKANIVANNIQHIFAVTEQTGEGTRSTAQQVRELSHMAEELRQSVARFKIS